MTTRVYIGRFDPRTSEREVEKFFRGYGKIDEIMMKNGFAFVEFVDSRDADDAVHDLSGKEFNGYRVVIDIARGTPHGRDMSRDRERGYFGGVGWGNRGGGGRGSPRYADYRTDYRLIVENLSSRISWQELKDTFRRISDVTYATAHNNRKNEGLLEFASRSDMRKAMREMDGKEMNGRKIRLTEEKPRKRSRSRSRSRSSSRSRSGSRSRSRSRSPRRRSRSRSRSESPRDRRRRKSSGADRKRSRSRSPTKSKSPPPRASGAEKSNEAPQQNGYQ